MKKHLTPFIKWPGGKTQELSIIQSYLPKTIQRYIEPFLGGGSVYFLMNHQPSFVNDISVELMTLYKLISTRDETFIEMIEEINHTWDILGDLVDDRYTDLELMYKDFKSDYGKLDPIKLKTKYENKVYNFVLENNEALNGLMCDHFNINIENFLKQVKRSLYNKMSRMIKLEEKLGNLSDDDIYKNIETAFKSAYYTHFRYLYNNREHYEISEGFSSAMFFYIREYCYSSMFRYNKNGHFNVPYGGISYNNKDFSKKIDYIKSRKLIKLLKETKFYTNDFEIFLNKIKPKKDDFIFLDPPYDTEFSTYAQNDFDKKDQIRLCEYLSKTEANFMLVIKNTDFIRNLYEKHSHFHLMLFDKKYMVSFKNRNNRDVDHLLITNYKLGE